jgi:hypothetical protein
MAGFDGITYRQHRQMELYLHFKNRPMTVSALFWFYRSEYTIILILGVVSILIACILQAYILTGILLAAYCILLLRDAANFRHSVEVWPVLKHLLTWDRVEKLGA